MEMENIEKRPIFLTIVTLLCIVGGLFFTWAAAIIFGSVPGLSEPKMELPFLLMMLFMFIQGAIFVAGGVGLIFRMKWAWWLISFCFTGLTIVCLFSLISAFIIPGNQVYSQIGFFGVCKELIPPILISSVALVYLFKQSILGYMGINVTKRFVYLRNIAYAVVVLYLVGGMAIALIIMGIMTKR